MTVEMAGQKKGQGSRRRSRGAGGAGEGFMTQHDAQPLIRLTALNFVKKTSYGFWLLTLGFWLIVSYGSEKTAFSQNLSPQPSVQPQKKFVCHQQSLETLTTQLLRDLPSYANRATQRGRRLRRSSDIYSYMLIAGRPEFQPLPLNVEGSNTDRQKKSVSDVEQVFFTTLERQYIDKKAVELQEFHWLLLTKTSSDWRFVMMFTQTGAYPQQQPPSPPRDSSNGSIAQGVKTWLRDCQAGSIRVR
ncbi:hypothetical protein GNE08_22715 [Trichormus variabilis ARAD]|nr:hypothetical protein [Trichormus variabilis ARAD]MBC1256519.1 hypothetical protein [Trichormus variabilis V5]MBC1268441.1 hypothetical protein [Trichormus variabilis FSR]MBC1300810.1 hypothetical protein [Trichormus variabilis N2B]MBC1312848.1 hypothetical protein [Trichormus variabilis PNB]MBC1328907.1 hypothetical protein [Trichormus variabilis 9RC]MBD2380505.1 hypothetical protein [Trichormus variabilis FACHB-319]QFZ11013.1 hypothetical protein EH233_02755 [Anabaena sp. YBS01]QHD80064